MPGSYDAEIGSLKAQLERDLKVYRGEKERFYRLEGIKDEEITEADRNTLVPWSRSTIREYSRKLETLEKKGSPSSAEKEVMQLLNRLIMLGDELSDMFNTFVQRIEKFQEDSAKTGIHSKAPLEAFFQAPPIWTPAAPNAETSFQFEQKQPVEPSNSSVAIMNPTDPQGVYRMLGVQPDASQEVVKRAIKAKMFSLHPDRSKRDPKIAAEEFAEFSALCNETVATEEKRRLYSSIKTVDELEQLTKRVRRLAMGA